MIRGSNKNNEGDVMNVGIGSDRKMPLLYSGMNGRGEKSIPRLSLYSVLKSFNDM